MKRALLILVLMWATCPAHAITPEVGKDRLRKLLKLPTVAFAADWSFDPERGFLLGSVDDDLRVQINDLRQALLRDNTDAHTWQSLGELYTALNDYRTAPGIWNRAAELYRKRVELQPDDAVLLASFGRSLAGAGRMDEAESILRRAVRTAPNEWKCRVALGRFLASAARRAILDRSISVPDGDGATVEAAPDRPSADEVALAQKQLDEAAQCFDQAVTLAPDEAEVYFRRAMHRCLQRAVLNRIRAAGDGTFTGAYDGCFSRESVNDLRRACDLDPTNYRRVGGAVLFQIFSYCAEKGDVNWESFSWNALPDAAQQSIRECLTRLDNLSQNGDARVAGGALEVLGILQGPILRQPNRCIASLERSLALQPARDRGWEILVATLAQAGRHDELLATCEDHVKLQDNARTRVLLAKAYERLKLWDSSEIEARTAAIQDPNDFTAGLSLAALLLKRSRGDDDALAEANTWLTRAENAIAKTARSRRNRQQLVDLTLTRGIYFALTDNLDSARTWVKAVIELDKNNQFARDILAAMDF